MCELLVAVVSKKNLDSVHLDSKLAKGGDVIVVMPDGHAWGGSEIGNPEWRVVRVPGEPDDAFDHLLARERATEPTAEQAPNVLQHRAFYIDLPHLADAAPGSVTTIAADDIHAAVKQRAPMVNAGVF